MTECQPATDELQKVFVLRFRSLNMKPQTFEAATAVIHGEHLVLLNAQGKLVALFLLRIVESWNEI